MAIATSGLHHVTAIGGNPQDNVDFYLVTLGLRLIKTTVNYDDPGTYHLYYGDEAGLPGSLLTFFPWRGVPSGREGAGQATTTAFSVPEHSIGWWQEHLTGLDVDTSRAQNADGEDTLSLRDPDGLALRLVAAPEGDPRQPWDSPHVPAEHAIRGLHSVTLSVREETATAHMLTETLGFSFQRQDGGRLRFAAGAGGPGALVDVQVSPQAPDGLVAGGTVHHVAWRVPDDATQREWRQELVDQGVRVTEIRDRRYFQSIYFREPGGTLFELATENGGFDLDEPLLELGRSLKLPPWLEPQREQIEAALPGITVPPENNPSVAAPSMSDRAGSDGAGSARAGRS